MKASKADVKPPRPEVYGNPFRKCSAQDVALYIHYKGKRTPICHRCCPKLAEDPRW